MAVPDHHIRVGVGVFILSSSTTSPSSPAEPTLYLDIIGKRINSHGSGTYALPGGHLEFGETPEECAAREVMEETGLKVSAIRLSTATNDYILTEDKHYVILFIVCERANDDEPKVLEPEKCLGWEGATWEELMGWARADGR